MCIVQRQTKGKALKNFANKGCDPKLESILHENSVEKKRLSFYSFYGLFLTYFMVNGRHGCFPSGILSGTRLSYTDIDIGGTGFCCQNL